MFSAVFVNVFHPGMQGSSFCFACVGRGVDFLFNVLWVVVSITTICYVGFFIVWQNNASELCFDDFYEAGTQVIVA